MNSRNIVHLLHQIDTSDNFLFKFIEIDSRNIVNIFPKVIQETNFLKLIEILPKRSLIVYLCEFSQGLLSRKILPLCYNQKYVMTKLTIDIRLTMVTIEWLP